MMAHARGARWTRSPARRQHALADEPLIQYLARRAYRDEWLHAPAVQLYPDRRWSKIDCENDLECPEQSPARRDQRERAWTSPIWYLP